MTTLSDMRDVCTLILKRMFTENFRAPDERFSIRVATGRVYLYVHRKGIKGWGRVQTARL